MVIIKNKKDMYEIKKTANDRKEECNKDIESQKKHSNRNPGEKSSLSQIKNTFKRHSSR
jgi:hypothetical protein